MLKLLALLAALQTVEVVNMGADATSGGEIVVASVWPARGAITGPVHLTLAGEPVLTQCSVVSTHADGSTNHALLAFRSPAPLEPGEMIDLEVAAGDAAPGRVPQPGPDVDLRSAQTSLAVILHVLDSDGERWMLAADPGWKGYRTAIEPIKTRWAERWGAGSGELRGGYATHLWARAPLVGLSGPHPTLAAQIHWTLLDDSGYLLRVVLESAELQAPGDVRINSAAVIADGKVVASVAGPITLHDRTQFAVDALVAGAERTQIVARQDRESLIAAGLLPPATWSGSRLSAAAAGRWIQPLGDTPGAPGDVGMISRGMPATGDHPGIGPVPRWVQAAVQSESWTAHEAALVCDLNGAMAYPVHARWIDGSLGMRVEDRDLSRQYWSGRPKLVAPNPNVPDTQHTPRLGFYGWVIGGDPMAADALASWACYQIADLHADTRRFSQIGYRGHAWALCQTALAARVLPDADPRRAYLAAVLLENLRADLRELEPKGPLQFIPRPQTRISARKSWAFGRRISVWQTSWLVAGWHWTSLLAEGEAAEIASELYQRALPYYAGAMDAVGLEWIAPTGTVVRFDSPLLAIAYETPVELFVPTIDSRGRIVEGESWWIGSWPEALYRLHCLDDHGYASTVPDLPLPPPGSDLPPGHPDLWLPTSDEPPQVKSYWVPYAIGWLGGILEEQGDPRWAEEVRRASGGETRPHQLLYTH